MTTIHQLKDSFEGNQRIAFVKGSPKEVMDYVIVVLKAVKPVQSVKKTASIL